MAMWLIKKQIFKSQSMPINKPIPDSVINYWKKVFQNFQAKFSGPKKSVWDGRIK